MVEYKFCEISIYGGGRIVFHTRRGQNLYVRLCTSHMQKLSSDAYFERIVICLKVNASC